MPQRFRLSATIQHKMWQGFIHRYFCSASVRLLAVRKACVRCSRLGLGAPRHRQAFKLGIARSLAYGLAELLQQSKVLHHRLQLQPRAAEVDSPHTESRERNSEMRNLMTMKYWNCAPCWCAY